MWESVLDPRHLQRLLSNGETRGIGDVGRQLQVPQCIVVTTMIPDMVLCSESECIIYFIESKIPFEDTIEEASKRKKQKW